MNQLRIYLHNIAKYKIVYLWISPFFILFGIFIAYPLVNSVILSLQKYSGFATPRFIGLKNYIMLFGDDRSLIALWNALWYWTVIIVPKLFLALILAYLLNQKWLKFGNFMKVVIFLPFITATVVTAIVFKISLAETGIANKVLNYLFGLKPIPWLLSEFWAKMSIALVGFWRTTGYSTLIMLAGLQRIPDNLYEAGAIDGCSKVKSFFYITIPLMKPIILYVLVMSSIWVFQIFAEVMVMTAGGPKYASTTIAMRMYSIGFESFRLGYAAAHAVIILIMCVTFSFFEFRILGRK